MRNLELESNYEQLNQLSKEELIDIIQQRSPFYSADKEQAVYSFYQQIFEASPDALLLIHQDSKQVLMCNEEAKVMFELNDKSELVGRHEYQFHKASANHDKWKRFRDNSSEVAYVSLKNRIFWGLREARHVQIEGETYELVRITDITARKETERRLAFDKARLKMLVEYTDDLVWSIDKHHYVTEFNAKAQREATKFAGVQIELNKQFFPAYGASRSSVESNWRNYFSRVLAGEKFTVQYFFHFAGQDFYYEFHFHPILNRQKVAGATIFGRDISERKLQEEKLRYTENLYRSVINTQHEMICRFQPDSTISFANHACVRYLGKPIDQLLGKRFLDIIPVNDQPRFIKKLRQIAKDGKPSADKYMLETFEGQRYWHHWTIIPVYNQDGILEEFQAAGLDITSKTIAENKLKTSEERFRTLVMAAPVGIFLTDKEGFCTWTNKKLQEIGHITHEEALGEGIFQNLHPEDKSRLFKSWQLAREKGELFHKTIDCRYLLKSGATKWFYVTFTPLMVEDQRAIGFVGIVEDFTDRKESVIKLKESEEKYKYLFTNNPNPLILLDSATDAILDVNEAAINKYGYSREEFIGMPSLTLLGDGETKHDWQFSERLDNISSSFHKVSRHKTKNGATIYANVQTHIFQQDGGTKELILIEDVTERKQYEDELIATKIELEKALKAKDEFLSVMSHEIRTPLNVIVGLSTLLQQQAHLPAQDETISTLSFSAEHLLSLVNDILDFSKLQAGKILLENIAYDMVELSRRTIRMFKAQAESKGIKLQLEIDDQLPQCLMGDPTRVNQVLNNLLSNAVKFTHKGTVKLILKPNKADRFSIIIKDSGIGMSAKEQQQVFKAFTQANSSTNRKYGGTGLGLTITKKLIALQNGSLQLESKEGEGTTFTVDLPLQEAQGSVCMNSFVQLDKNTLSGLHALYVEDMEPNQFLMKGFCEYWGIQLQIATNGQEALDILQSTQKFDVILMDIMMPVMDGYETASKIRSMRGEYFKKVPIIAVTASVSNKEQRKYLKHGMNDFVEKPINSEELAEKLCKNVAKASFPKKETSKASKVGQKNMFALLEEYHQKNPNAYKDLLLTSSEQIKEYRTALMLALEENDINSFREQAHNLVNVLSHIKQNECIRLLKQSKDRFESDKECLREDLDEAFSQVFAYIDEEGYKK